MTTTINISLPPEQLDLLEQLLPMVESLLSQQKSKQWLTLHEVCERFSKSEKVIRNWMDHDGLPVCEPTPGNKLFNAADVDAWMKSFQSRSLKQKLDNAITHHKRKAA